jgi:hypothetical protein
MKPQANTGLSTPELANVLFHQEHAPWVIDVHPRLIHTRSGFHILEAAHSPLVQ